MSISSQEQQFILKHAEKMQPSWVKSKIVDPKNRNSKPLMEAPIWNELSIAGGFTGVFPLFIELDRLFPDKGWDLITHNYVLAIKDSVEENGIPVDSMFGGLAGVCYFLHEASKGGTRYLKMLTKLHKMLEENIRHRYLLPYEKALDHSQPVHFNLYEVIQGLSGIGIYFLKSRDAFSSEKLISKIISLFVKMTAKIKIKGESVPGWYIASEDLFLHEEKAAYRNGSFNLGLSHGITGVLAFLSVALLNGVSKPGQGEAIVTIVDWLKKKRKFINGRWFWDATVSFAEEIAGGFSPQRKSRDAWCYGTPGVARSLYLAGTALNDQSLQEYALESFASIFESTQKEWDLPGPTFCHGISGLLMITHLMVRDSNSSFLNAQVERLKTILLTYYDSDSPFGFQNYEPMKDGNIAKINRADLLEGAAGVFLTLLSLNSKSYSWHYPFLIDY